MNVRVRRPSTLAAVVLSLTSAIVLPAVRGDEPAADSPMVKLLKSGRVPAERQGTVIEMIGRRGTVADLDYVYQRALDPTAPPPIRGKALDALADAASTRGLKPARDLNRLTALMAKTAVPADEALREPAIRLAGAWKLEPACAKLREIAGPTADDERLRQAAIDALATIGGRPGRSAIEELAGPAFAMPIRIAAVATLTRLEPEAAAARAAELIPLAAAQGIDLKPVMEGFLNRKGGGAILAKAIAAHPIPADAAKLALRAVYSFSQSDPALVDTLGKAAGMATEVKALSPSEMSSLIAEVVAKGDPARGEAVFRRKDLNCMTCHAVSKAGGDIGPDLSAVGQTSPPDYLIDSVLLPDQSIKEQYHTMVVLTVDGQVYQGIVMDRDARRVVLKEATGALRTVPVDSIEEQKPGGSLMPKGLVNLMTHAEFLDLIRFLSELGKPGPYAIRTTPTIQRWRVLRAVSAGLTEAVPDAETLRDMVLRAAPGRWTTVYGKVGGALPLDEAVVASGGGKVLYLQGEIDVTEAGEIRISPQYPDAIRFWVDELPAPLGTREFTTTVAPGRHAITVRVDSGERREGELTIQVDKTRDSTAEFTVVGGK